MFGLFCLDLYLITTLATSLLNPSDKCVFVDHENQSAEEVCEIQRKYTEKTLLRDKEFIK